VDRSRRTPLALHSPLVLAGLAAFVLACALTAPAALALDSGAYSVEILVRGAPVREYSARDAVYVEALKGREYSVRLTNHTGERVAVALAVDGLNSIDAKATSAREASKWILGPFESITIDGWQTSNSTARQFFFTSEKKSYGAWLGQTNNLGVVTAAFFRERPRLSVAPMIDPAPYGGRQYPAEPQLEKDSRNQAGRDRGDAPSSSVYPSAPPPAARDSAEGSARGKKESAAPESGDSYGGVQAGSESKQKADGRPPLSDQLAATGIGRERDHLVRQIEFDEQDSPSSVLEMRYEYRDALVRLGVLPRPCDGTGERLARRESAHGFSDTGYAPDPYRPGCR
jgi:hypothetical protein